MLRIAVSGHRGLPAPTRRLVDAAIRAALNGQQDVTGWSCLADGADQIFARAVLDHGGRIEVVIPAARYRDGLPRDVCAEYDRLLAQAAEVHQLPFTESTPEALMAASEFKVTCARDNGLPVSVIWPDGAQRD